MGILPTYLEDLLESIQRKALRIIFGKLEHASAMPMAGLGPFTPNLRELLPAGSSSKKHGTPVWRTWIVFY